jgi:hypothetical protein
MIIDTDYDSYLASFIYGNLCHDTATGIWIGRYNGGTSEPHQFRYIQGMTDNNSTIVEALVGCTNHRLDQMPYQSS